MKAIVKERSGVGLVLAEVRPPVPGPADVMIRVSAAAICGSDIPIHAWNDPWTRATVRPGQIVGHEFVGTVAACGSDVQGIEHGELVTAEGHLFCGECYHCRRGEAHVCPNQHLIGFDAPGAFSEFVTVPARNIVRLPSIPLAFATLLDPIGNAVHAVFSAENANAEVLVSGCGPVGLMTIGISKAMGASVIFAADPSPYRRRLAKAVGADHVLDPTVDDLCTIVRSGTRSRTGVDVFYEMSGASSSLQNGLKVTRPCGQAVLLGLPKQDIPCDIANEVVAKAVTLTGIVGRRVFQTWQESIPLCSNEADRPRIGLRSIITHLLPIEDFEHGFSLMQGGNCGKVILAPDRGILERMRSECVSLGVHIES